MRHIGVRIETCNATGELAMFLDGMRNADYFSGTFEGYGIAHDLLDHQNGIRSIGSIADEIEAMGGIWFIRGEVGEIRRNSFRNPHEMLAGDFVSLFEIYALKNVPIRSGKHHTWATEDIDLDIDQIIEEARPNCRWVREDMEFPHEYSRKLAEFTRAWRNHMRIGYRKAYRRFKGDGNKAHSQFWNITDAVDDLRFEFEGQRFRLSYGDGEATFQEIFEDWY